VTASKLYPGAARALVELALRAGWKVTAGPHLDEPHYSITLNAPPPDLDVTYTAKWRYVKESWQIWYAERRVPRKADEIRLDEIAAAIKATERAP
jgi:hypothetical protein